MHNEPIVAYKFFGKLYASPESVVLDNMSEPYCRWLGELKNSNKVRYLDEIAWLAKLGKMLAQPTTFPAQTQQPEKTLSFSMNGHGFSRHQEPTTLKIAA